MSKRKATPDDWPLPVGTKIWDRHGVRYVVGNVDGQVVFKWWHSRQQYWRYIVEDPGWFRMFTEEGLLEIERGPE